MQDDWIVLVNALELWLFQAVILNIHIICEDAVLTWTFQLQDGASALSVPVFAYSTLAKQTMCHSVTVKKLQPLALCVCFLHLLGKWKASQCFLLRKVRGHLGFKKVLFMGTGWLWGVSCFLSFVCKKSQNWSYFTELLLFQEIQQVHIVQIRVWERENAGVD